MHVCSLGFYVLVCDNVRLSIYIGQCLFQYFTQGGGGGVGGIRLVIKWGDTSKGSRESQSIKWATPPLPEKKTTNGRIDEFGQYVLCSLWPSLRCGDALRC